MDKEHTFLHEDTEIPGVRSTKTVDHQQKSQKGCEVIVKFRLRWTIEKYVFLAYNLIYYESAEYWLKNRYKIKKMREIVQFHKLLNFSCFRKCR